jgi:hypothetical protein
MIHPIFSPFFEFSHRKKRKLVLSEVDLLGLVHDSSKTIQAILARNNRTLDEPLPEQLSLFKGYYDGGS